MKRIDAATSRLAEYLIRFRWWVIAVTVMVVALAAAGGRFLEFSNNYRVFFGKENPELLAFEDFQATYTKNDNILIVIQPADRKVFKSRVTEAVETATREAWNIPYAIRVDSISNFQYSWADGDDLTVEDLIRDSGRLSQAQLDGKAAVALAEPLLRNNLISNDADTTGINVTLQYPEKSITEVPEAVGVAREIVADLKARYPELTVVLTGVSMLNNTFAESGLRDLQTLVPLMYLVLILVMAVTLRSASGTVATLMVIGFSSASAMGLAGHMGVKLTPISTMAPPSSSPWPSPTASISW